MIALARVPLTIFAALRAWITLEPAHWRAVADHLAPLTARFPGLQRWHAQALRSGQRPVESAALLAQALSCRPGDPQLLREWGRSLRLAGDRPRAIAAWQQAAAAGNAAATGDLIRFGARDALPSPQAGVYARPDYPAYAAANRPPEPPSGPVRALFRIISDGAGPDSPLATSLAAQTHPAWTLDNVPAQWADRAVYTVALPARAWLDPQALAWLNHAIAATGCAAVTADHDHAGSDGYRRDPVLRPRFDRLWQFPDGFAAHGHGSGTCHVPLVLATLPVLPVVQPALPDADPQPLSVIIPTRDNPAMLAAAIASLRANARRSDAIEIVIVDNGSETPAGRALLDELEQDPAVRIVPFAEPFNWSRAGNLGAAAARHDRLLFLNDDTEMRTQGWDRILAGMLADPRVGLVGARMVYPDGRIQHAGFVFGMDNGPQHDGRWRDGTDAGPAGRWSAVRETVAVTGAFIAISRADFTAAGAFDERGLAIDFADVDLCLRLRQRGRIVAYCGAITLLHHESVSRGLNVSRAKRRRMQREWRLLQSRWGAAVVQDPYHHPAWARGGAPHDGLSILSIGQITSWTAERTALISLDAIQNKYVMLPPWQSH